ncbi:DUF3040 domain-containing protein [Paractinoplanes rishiriensis]|uniref:DUF3040 domain-containing protein n=1 Tax=Paractinoplanes rishiriensis TaxID=1050105 RepID=UPI00194320D8|nr:DUF3040 domain-containing protein [Actinoplanes rishiriensis]
MLDPNEKAVFDGMVTQLRADDPRLAQRWDRLCRPKRRIRTALAFLLWTTAPLCIVFGGWTGLIVAVVAAAYGAVLYLKRGPGTGETLWPSHRKPRVAD